MFCLITYDLKKVKNYPRLYACLNQWGAQRLLESVWIANVVGPCPSVRQVLQNYIDGDDAIAVIELVSGADWSTLRVRTGGLAMLTHVTPREAA